MFKHTGSPRVHEVRRLGLRVSGLIAVGLLLGCASNGTGGDVPEDVPGLDTALGELSDEDVPTTDATGDVDAEVSADGPQNVLLIIADDLGIDASECYGMTGNIASTPNIRALCEAGVVFENAWVTPTCSPTRATMLTGRYPLRHGVGAPVGGGNPSLGNGETTLPGVLGNHPQWDVAHANIGKWHLTAGMNALSAPNDFGWGHYSGIFSGAVPDFFNWTKTVNGVQESVSNYATTELVDDAIGWIGAQEAQSRPWVLWLAFNAPHTPFHVPPAGLHTQTLGVEGACPAGQDATCYRAAIEAMDAELGRLLGTLSPEVRARTHIIYLGDNGSPTQVAQSPVPAMRAKGTLFEGGVRVPFIVAGPAVVAGGRSVDAIIDGSDVFGTVLELAGMSLTTVASLLPVGTTTDSVSIVPYLQNPTQAPLRDWVVTELHASVAGDDRPGRAIRDDRFKLILFEDGREALYDLGADPWESEELITLGLGLEAQASYDTLKAVLQGLLATP